VDSPLAEIERILAQREKRYLAADKVLSTDNRSIEQVAKLVVEFYSAQTS
jgi:shikimate kinase